jgi:hypothetical protein
LRLSGREAEAQRPAVPPRDGQLQVSKADVDEDGVVAAQGEVNGDGVRGDAQGAGVVEEVPPDGVGGGAGGRGRRGGRGLPATTVSVVSRSTLSGTLEDSALRLNPEM